MSDTPTIRAFRFPAQRKVVEKYPNLVVFTWTVENIAALEEIEPGCSNPKLHRTRDDFRFIAREIHRRARRWGIFAIADEDAMHAGFAVDGQTEFLKNPNYRGDR